VSSVIPDVVRAALSEYLRIEDREPTPSAAQPELSAYAGRYSRPFADVLITIENGAMLVQIIRKGGAPYARAPGPKVPHAFSAKDNAIATVAKSGQQSSAHIQFLRDADGKIQWVRVGNRIARKTAVTPPPPRYG